MTRKRLTPSDIERILAGRVSPDDPDLGSLSRAVAEVRDAYSGTPSGDVRTAHLAAMRAALGEAPGAEPSRTRKRRFGFAARVGTAAAGLVLVTGAAMAAMGTLPDAVQSAVSDAANTVGLHIPTGEDEDGDDTGAPASEQPSNPTAAENKARADEYTAAKKAWTECVAEQAPQSEEGAFDPEEACGPKPQPEQQQQAPGQQEEHPTASDHPGVGPPAEGEQRGNSGDHIPPDAGPPADRGNN